MSVAAVVDTNVLVSGIFWKGPPFEILSCWRRGRFTLILSVQILEEYRRVLLELAEKTRTSTPTNQILELIELYAQMVDPASFSTSVCDDPDDDKFLEAAVAANADYVVSGDKALLRIRKYGGTQIVNPSQFLRILAH